VALVGVGQKSEWRGTFFSRKRRCRRERGSSGQHTRSHRRASTPSPSPAGPCAAPGTPPVPVRPQRQRGSLAAREGAGAGLRARPSPGEAAPEGAHSGGPHVLCVLSPRAPATLAQPLLLLHRPCCPCTAPCYPCIALVPLHRLCYPCTACVTPAQSTATPAQSLLPLHSPCCPCTAPAAPAQSLLPRHSPCCPCTAAAAQAWPRRQRGGAALRSRKAGRKEGARQWALRDAAECAWAVSPKRMGARALTQKHASLCPRQRSPPGPPAPRPPSPE